MNLSLFKSLSMPTTQWISSNHEITFAPRHGLSKQARPYVAMILLGPSAHSIIIT